MAYFVSLALRGLLLICTIQFSTNAVEIRGHLPDVSVINNFLDSFIKPYLQTIFANRNKPIMRVTNHDTKPTRASSTVYDVIDMKIAELRPLLQDAEEKVQSVDNLTVDVNDEQTTILEFIPKIERIGDTGEGDVKPNTNVHQKLNGVKPDINKYKHMLGKIKKMMHNENVSNDTRYTVINTLDDIIAQLIDNQCTWKAVDRIDNPVFRSKHLNELISKVRNLTDDQWSELRIQYEGFLQQKGMQKDTFLDMFHDFFSKVVNDTHSLMNKKYKIRCKLIEIDKEKQATPRYNTVPEGHKNKCALFKLCSEELKEFMKKFYYNLNDTIVSAYKNYAEMYVRDVNMDADLDKDTVVSIANHIGDVAEKKVAKIFKKQIKNIKLDKNKDRSANIKHLTDFIKSTVERVKKFIKKRTETELSTLRTKLYLSIKEDLDVNVDVDLGNLERLFIDGICTRFVLCNGGYSLKRRARKNIGKLKDSNSIHVDIKLTLDDEVKLGIAKVQSKLAGLLRNNRKYYSEGLPRTNVFNEKFSNLTVTRTTTAVTTNTTLTTVDTHINEV